MTDVAADWRSSGKSRVLSVRAQKVPPTGLVFTCCCPRHFKCEGSGTKPECVAQPPGLSHGPHYSIVAATATVPILGPGEGRKTICQETLLTTRETVLRNPAEEFLRIQSWLTKTI
ncbi:hypothetical protein Q8A67_002687 [Cirrhinus molitorella]|uniref:Uncharacterized protein n=1 Tax=Cirrhinus molitorella TaxID=172907 RepID=A0AA88TX27_9TELE|nr:hypothetical protein Q8A67_002687 [Cirrhinus molitorella]